MKIRDLLLIILGILYGYWIGDLYIFVYNHGIYNPEKLDDYFNGFKIIMYLLNYPLFIITIIFIIPYRKINKILNRRINFNLNIFKNNNYEN
jgi:hypothetical protein